MSNLHVVFMKIVVVAQLMHLRYDKQLEFKTDLLGQALKKFKPANFESYDIRPTIGMEQPQHYRAKTTISNPFFWWLS